MSIIATLLLILAFTFTQQVTLPLPGTTSLLHLFQYVHLDPQLNLQVLGIVGGPINLHFPVKVRNHLRYCVLTFSLGLFPFYFFLLVVV